MKTSELIKALQDSLAKHGDLPVVTPDPEAYRPYDVNEVLASCERVADDEEGLARVGTVCLLR